MDTQTLPENKTGKPGLNGNLSDHLANERTYLAWVRTSIGIMAFGFVVVKFTLFVKQLSFVLQKPALQPGRGYSSIIGVLLVCFGALVGVLAFLRYKKTERLLSDASYRPSSFLSAILAGTILLIGILLVGYLLLSI